MGTVASKVQLQVEIPARGQDLPRLFHRLTLPFKSIATAIYVDPKAVPVVLLEHLLESADGF